MGLDALEVVFAIEDEFGVGVHADDFETLTTAGDFSDYIVSRLRERGASIDEPSVWDRFCHLLASHATIEPGAIDRACHLSRDLRLY